MTRRNEASRRFLFLVLVQFLITINYYCRAKKVTCEQSAGRNSMGATCEGDYCFYAELPGIEKPVRGCLSGDLMRKDIVDQCEHSVLNNRDVCICSKDGCNVNANGIKQQKTNLVQCYQCEKNCSKETFCYGEYCVVTRYSKTRIVRGCSNPSMPLFERKGLGSCVTPSFPSHTEDRNWDESTLSAVTCMCNDRKFCNGVDLSQRIQSGLKMKKCRVRAYASTKLGTHPSPSVPECKGEHCFNILIELGGVTSNVSGCLSYHDLSGKDGDRKPPQHEELNDGGCMTINSETLRAKACFDTDELRDDDSGGEGGDESSNKKGDFEAGDEAPKSREPDYAKGEKNGDKTGKNRQKTGKSDKSRAHQLAKNKTPKERQSPPNPDEEGGEKKDKESQQVADADKPKPSHFIHGDVDPDNPVLKPESEGNTAIVAVFVAIMVLIVIAGVVWKFELHKKIFHARYQTVAG